MRESGNISDKLRHYLRSLVLGSVLLISFAANAANPHGQFIMGGSPSQPSLAAANGFNRNTFYSNFSSLSPFDLNDTLFPGFMWYMQRTRANTDTVTTKSDLSLNSTGLNFTCTEQRGSGPTFLCQAPTIGYNYTAGSSVGASIAATGFLVEGSMSISPYPGGCPGPLSIWLVDHNNELEIATNNFTGNKYVEIDVPEVYPGAFNVCQTAGTTGVVNMQLHEWQNGAVINSSPASPTAYAVANNNSQHTYDVLWLTKAQNAGTGVFRFYIDGVQQGSDITYTTGAFSEIEQSKGMDLVLQSGTSWSTTIKSVQIWQP